MIGKTEFIIFKPPRKSLKNRVTLKLNGKTLFESKKKYLGLIVDDILSWKFHINELSKKLGRAIGIIYRLKHMNCPKLCYGLMAWGSASKIPLFKSLEILIFGISLNINLAISCLILIMVIFQMLSNLYLLKSLIHQTCI